MFLRRKNVLSSFPCSFKHLPYQAGPGSDGPPTKRPYMTFSVLWIIAPPLFCTSFESSQYYVLDMPKLAKGVEEIVLCINTEKIFHLIMVGLIRT